MITYLLENAPKSCFSLNIAWLQVTGSGKTLAFVIPIIELLLKREEKLKKMQVRMRLYLNSLWSPPDLLDAESVEALGGVSCRSVRW